MAQAYTYAAYGELLAIHNGLGSPHGNAASAALTSMLYNGESFDGRIGQLYLRARWYDGHRFITIDPYAGDASSPFSFNKYSFATGGDPILYADPSGMFEGLGGFMAGMSISSAMRKTNNEVQMNALSAAVSSYFAHNNGGNFFESFLEDFASGLNDSAIGAVPFFGSLYNLYQLGEGLANLIGAVFDVSAGAGFGSVNEARVVPAGLRAIFRSGQFTLSKYWTKVRPGMQVDAIQRTGNDFIPLVGRAQRTGGRHEAVVLEQAKLPGSDPRTELVAMNLAISTILRTVDGVHDPFIQRHTGAIITSCRGAAKTVGSFRPDVVAVKSNGKIEVVEVLSVSQGKDFANTVYLGYLQDALRAFQDVGLTATIRVVGDNGQVMRILTN